MREELFSKYREVQFYNTKMFVAWDRLSRPWFDGKTIAKILGYKNATEAVKKYCRVILLVTRNPHLHQPGDRGTKFYGISVLGIKELTKELNSKVSYEVIHWANDIDLHHLREKRERA